MNLMFLSIKIYIICQDSLSLSLSLSAFISIIFKPALGKNKVLNCRHLLSGCNSLIPMTCRYYRMSLHLKISVLSDVFILTEGSTRPLLCWSEIIYHQKKKTLKTWTSWSRQIKTSWGIIVKSNIFNNEYGEELTNELLQQRLRLNITSFYAQV